MPNIRLNVLYPRRYRTQGQEQVHWMTVGSAWMTDKGIDVKLWVTPPADSEGTVKLILREPNREESRAAQGQEDGWQEQPQRYQQRPQQRAQPQRSQYHQQQRPQYGGAAAPQQPPGQAAVDRELQEEDSIPF